MSDAWIVVLAFSTGLGALYAHALPAYLVVAAAAIAVLGRSKIFTCAVAAVVASVLAAHGWSGLDAPVAATVDGPATIVRDPEWSNGALKAEVKISGRHFQLWARNESAKVLRPKLAGEQIILEGTVSPLSGLGAPSQRRKHVAGRINATSIRDGGRGSAMARATNDIRRLLGDGAQSLPADNRALLLGVVLGDDREQSPAVHDDFEAAGLLHLTAVSGANVAFVLLVFTPLFMRFGLFGRFAGAATVLLLFGVMTRWEPSVVRAEAMAFIVLIGMFLGRPVSLWRALGLGCTLALLADPFLVGSIGFLLSASACVGMALLGERLVAFIRGPLLLRRAIAYSAGAQIGVAPVQLAVFGPLPLAGLPANVLAEPLAAGLMIWGLVGGLAAGIAGEPVATLIHGPTYLLTTALGAVAHGAHSAALGSWNLQLVALVVVVAGLVAVRRLLRKRTDAMVEPGPVEADYRRAS